MGIRCADHVTPLYPQKLALTSPTGGGRGLRPRNLVLVYELVTIDTDFIDARFNYETWFSVVSVSQEFSTLQYSPAKEIGLCVHCFSTNPRKRYLNRPKLNFQEVILFLGGPGSSVVIATDYGLDVLGSNPDGARFSAVQTGPGAHPAFCTIGIGSFPRVESSRVVPLTPHPLLVLGSKNRVKLYLYSP